MSKLLLKPQGQHGKVHDVSPGSAGWGYVGFQLYKLKAGDEVSSDTGTDEAILVLVEGKAELQAAGVDFGLMGERMNVFERKPPHALYTPGQSHWQVQARTECTLAVCLAPGSGKYPAQRLGPEGIALLQRGQGSNTRFIYNIAMEQRDVAESLLVTEVFTPQGNWSSYPPHRHDVDDYPNITYLEETYYHRLNPANGYAHQRVFCEDGSLDESMAVADGDVVLVPKGHHPCGAPYGIDLYYLNVMAGPMRKWRFQNHPDFDWIYQRDK